MEKHIDSLKLLEAKLIKKAKDPETKLEEMVSIIEIAKDVGSVIDRINDPTYDWSAV